MEYVLYDRNAIDHEGYDYHLIHNVLSECVAITGEAVSIVIAEFLPKKVADKIGETLNAMACIHGHNVRFFSERDEFSFLVVAKTNCEERVSL